MTYSYFCGIDISKNHVDLSLIDNGGNHVFTAQSPNQEAELCELLDKLPAENLSRVLFCAENTGMYG